MKKHLNFRNIAIVVLILWIILQNCNPGGIIPSGKTIKVDGKKYEVIKHEIDTVEVLKEKVITKKGKDIFHEVIEFDTVIMKEFVEVDTSAILKDYLSKVVYKDTLILPDSLGVVSLTDTITKNRIDGRTWNAKVKERIIKETLIVKDPPKSQLYFGVSGNFDRENVIAGVGAGLAFKTKKDKLYQINLGVNNQQKLSPFIGVGTFWKIKLKK